MPSKWPCPQRYRSCLTKLRHPWPEVERMTRTIQDAILKRFELRHHLADFVRARIREASQDPQPRLTDNSR
ncbi:putative Exodeoxyribonuclease 7 small subunit [Mesorhizobium sp. STM 4661]|nr:putative Exodeoxyribonuclease 7 small subunit [Mesorhizobium sp. STM 4661]